jgi:putative aldouronate transport system permease protein
MSNLSTVTSKQNLKKVKHENSFIKNFKKRKMLYLMSIPGIIFYLIFKYLPMYGIIVAFQNYNPFKGVSALWTSQFVGIHWFQILFQQQVFFTLLRNTFLISVYSIVFGFPAPIILALILNEVSNTTFNKITQTVPMFLTFYLGQ